MKRAFVVAFVVLHAACFPTFEDLPYLITRPRILAVKIEPPESAPAKPMSFEALIASPEGTVGDQAVAWSLCLRARTLAERNGVTPECSSIEHEAVQPAEGRRAEVPVDACALFGPNPPPMSDPDQPPLRPADPDGSGGYYLPVRAFLESENFLAFGFERLRCSLAGAPREVSSAFEATYEKNENPAIDRVELEPSGAIAPSQQVRINAFWTADTAERYPYYDALAVKLVDRVESMSVSWFATDGRFDVEKSGRSEEEISAGMSSTENSWTAPDQPGVVTMWLVLRDSRGGSTWRELHRGALSRADQK